MEVLVYGAASSAVYALLAVGFSLIFGVARILNLAHGAFYAVGAYATYALTALAGVPIVVAAILAVAAVAAMGMAMERILVRPFRRSQMAVLLITLVFALMIEQILLVTFGSQARNVPSMVEGTVTVLGADISAQRLLCIAVGAAALAALWLFIQKTRLGAAILAISQDAEGAQYVGIPADRIYTVVMGISAALAAIAGVLVAPFLTVSPAMGFMPLLKAFSIVIVGGLGSIWGSVLAALLLGYVETVVAFELSFAWAQILPIVVVLITLILRPSGLFGRRVQ